MPALPSSACLALALAFALLPVAHGQSRYDAANVIPKADPIHPLLAAYQANMQKREEERKESRSVFCDWIKVNSPAAAQLFPKLRFAALKWDMQRHPDAKGPVSLALGLEMVVAIDTTKNRLARELWVYGNHEEFGKLLADAKVTLRDAKDAQRIWEASCEIYGQGSKTYPSKKISDTEWRLGISSFDQPYSVVYGLKSVVTHTHYLRVQVDPKTGHVTSTQTRSDASKERLLPAK